MIIIISGHSSGARDSSEACVCMHARELTHIGVDAKSSSPAVWGTAESIPASWTKTVSSFPAGPAATSGSAGLTTCPPIAVASPFSLPATAEEELCVAATR